MKMTLKERAELAEATIKAIEKVLVDHASKNHAPYEDAHRIGGVTAHVDMYRHRVPKQ